MEKGYLEFPEDREKISGIVSDNPDIRIRKLTPLECWRLMGFSDEDHNAAEQVGISNSQRYKEAGNSICVNVLEAIFGQLIPGKENEYKERWG